MSRPVVAVEAGRSRRQYAQQQRRRHSKRWQQLRRWERWHSFKGGNAASTERRKWLPAAMAAGILAEVPALSPGHQATRRRRGWWLGLCQSGMTNTSNSW